MNESMNEIIESFNEYLDKLPSGCAVIADLFRKDQHAMGLENIDNFIGGLNWVINMTELLKEQHIVVALHVEQLNPFLTEINEAIEVEDYNLLADIFEYELVDFFTNIEKIQLAQ